MRLYTAAPWSAKPAVRATVELLERAGHSVPCRWWEHPDTSDHAELQRQAKEDRRGVERCEVFVGLWLGVSEGKSFELGCAVMLDKPCIVYVPYEKPSPNIFLHLPEVYRVNSIESLISALQAEEIYADR